MTAICYGQEFTRITWGKSTGDGKWLQGPFLLEQVKQNRHPGKPQLTVMEMLTGRQG